MKFLTEYKQIKNNYCSLKFIDKFILWTRFKVSSLNKLLELVPPRGKMLDLGCGFGVLSYFFAWRYPNLQVSGIDPLKSRIKIAKNVFSKPKNLSFKQGKVENLIEKDFDLALLVDVIYLLSRKELIRTLETCYKKANKGGALIIKTMNKDRSFRYLLSMSIPSLIGGMVSLSRFLPKSIKKTVKKIFGLRESFPRYYHSNELIKILKKAGWQSVKTYDLPLKFFWYPNIVYFCKKK